MDPVRVVDFHTGKINNAILENPQRANLYVYSLNNPYRYVDKDGLFPGQNPSYRNEFAVGGGMGGPPGIRNGSLNAGASRLPGMASAEVLAEETSIAAKGGTKLLNPPIKITQEGMQHVLERHTYNDIAKFSGKSKFNQGENILQLIQYGVQQPMINK